MYVFQAQILITSTREHKFPSIENTPDDTSNELQTETLLQRDTLIEPPEGR